ncbi:hypothetical protein K503DRAFT_518446 [Rhizopogon vinicolor AM-OR11-026]|uniref:Uncharacterized protein n=1 Tax=Rhizopogon vinicolor AM-OR11-026 TaxID=1314800 RepID=A0A1B7MLM2_9AGAM|nr:hypothetical protein K503DRAFT_518446 [Rhizopogon vinicolor AM-OR11-026]
MTSSHTSGEEFILWGTYRVCAYFEDYDSSRTSFVAWILGIVWEVLAVCLALWIAAKHLRELQQRPTGSTTGDCLTVLIKSHIYYFTGVAVVTCFTLGNALSPKLSISTVFNGVLEIVVFVQMFVLGPRLLLSVREYHAEHVVNPDTGTGMTIMAVQVGIPMSTAGGGDT